MNKKKEKNIAKAKGLFFGPMIFDNTKPQTKPRENVKYTSVS